jgi:hypothetical protein
MSHLNNTVVQAARGSEDTLGDLVHTPAGQAFTGIVCVAALFVIVYLLFFKGRGKSGA